MYDSNLIKKRLNKLNGTGPSFDKLQYTVYANNHSCMRGGRQSIIQKAAIE